MKRNCPICTSAAREIFHRQEFIDGTFQEVAFCCRCGFPYAWDSPLANYDVESRYATANGLGSGENREDADRHAQTVYAIAQHVPLGSTVLDIGCARGGLIKSLGNGSYKAVGMDPSADCVAACEAKGLSAYQGKLESESTEKYDCVILSHVLEHCWDVPAALDGIRRRLKPGGKFYIEVPDAARYLEFLTIPYFDFNREHINHFDWNHLRHALGNAGLENGNCLYGKRDFTVWGVRYPAIYAIGTYKQYSLLQSLHGYMQQSNEMLTDIDRKLRGKISVGEPIIVWGYGEFLHRLMQTSIMKAANIVQVVDRDSAKLGIRFNGIVVQPPAAIVDTSATILIASIANAESIRKDAEEMGFKNKIVEIQ